MGVKKGISKIIEPVGIGVCIIVEIYDDVARRLHHACVARVAQPAVNGADQPKRIFSDDVRKVIR